jgi:hypothetical protein
MSLHNLNENHFYMIIMVLLIVALYLHFNMKHSEGFSNLQPTQNYNFVHKNIMEQNEVRHAPQCDLDEIQIGEYCKKFATDEYTRICEDDEKYSDGFCIKKCGPNQIETGNPNVCLSRCPEGFVDDGYNCIEFKFLNIM